MRCFRLPLVNCSSNGLPRVDERHLGSPKAGGGRVRPRTSVERWPPRLPRAMGRLRKLAPKTLGVLRHARFRFHLLAAADSPANSCAASEVAHQFDSCAAKCGILRLGATSYRNAAACW